MAKKDRTGSIRDKDHYDAVQHLIDRHKADGFEPTYGLVVQGDALTDFPRGSRVYLDPSFEVKVGDYAAVWPLSKLQAPALFRLVTAPPPDGVASNELQPVLIVAQDSPKKQFVIPMKNIRAVHPVIGCSRPGAAPKLPGDWDEIQQLRG